MTGTRLVAFSDGVLAIVITVLVLGLRVPAGDDIAALVHTAGGGLLSYLLSFGFVGIYWNNHHHLFQLAGRVTGSTLWANLHLLFWLSLLPFTTAWIAGTGFAHTPLMTYGVNLLAAGLAFVALQVAIMRAQGPDSVLRRALGRDVKGKLSVLLYLAGIGGAWAGGSGVAIGCFVAAAALWLVPDRRIRDVVEARTG